MSLDIRNVYLASDRHSAKQLFTVRCDGAEVKDIFCSSEENEAANIVVEGGGGLLLPSLCHSHIHLDKCFIVDKGSPLVTGDFQEALEVTSQVKSRFQHEPDDLYVRGTRLIRESVENGVTSMRAHVEVDQLVESTCVQVGLRLRLDWSEQCDVQIALFMQEPLFDDADGNEQGLNAEILTRVLTQETGFSAIGSAPYVEQDDTKAKRNIIHILNLAVEFKLHVDFHLDYNLSPSTEPLIHFLIRELHELDWVMNMPGKMITVGHVTRLSLFGVDELCELRKQIGQLPIVLVGLPQSDVYMMGRGNPASPRGTLQVPQLIDDYDLSVAMAVNNVANAFTPQGIPDPLSLCPLGVAIYQAGTENHCRTLLKSITLNSKRAIGEPNVPSDLVPAPGDKADFVLLHHNDSVQSAALSPCWDRTTIKSGVVVAWRKSNNWSSFEDSSRMR